MATYRPGEYEAEQERMRQQMAQNQAQVDSNPDLTTNPTAPPPAAPPPTSGPPPATAAPQPSNPSGMPAPWTEDSGNNVGTGTTPAWQGGPNLTMARPSYDDGLPDLLGGLDTSGFASFDDDFAGASQQAADEAYAGLTQYMDEDFGRDRASLETQLINQGLQPGTEAFDRQMSLMQRGQNDSRMQAAIQAGQIGHGRAGDLLARALETRRLQAGEAGQDQGMRLSARGALTGERERDADRIFGQSSTAAQLGLGARGQDRGLDATLAGVSASAAASNAAAANARYNTDTSRDLTLRGYGLQQDQMDFNQLMALINGSRAGVNVPNFGAPGGLDVGTANSIASSNSNNALARRAADRGALASLGATALSGVDWGSLFG